MNLGFQPGGIAVRADRLLSILLMLQSRGKITSRELADTLEVSERTILRDMEALSASGIPVLAERGREGGWMLTEGYRTSLTGMKPKEMGSLLLSADPAILNDLGIKEDFSAAARKLEAASSTLPGSPLHFLTRCIHIDGAGWHPTDETVPHLALLQEAVWQNHKVQMAYIRDGERVERLISPLGLVAKRGVWYVVAESGGELRTYRVSRISGASLTDETFIRPESFELARYWEESTQSFRAALPRYQVTLLLTEKGLHSLRQERYVTITDQAPASLPGWLSVHAEMSTAEFALRTILSLGPDALVSEPQELHDSVLSSLRQTTLLYEDKM